MRITTVLVLMSGFTVLPLNAQTPLSSGVTTAVGINGSYLCTAFFPSRCIVFGETFTINVPPDATRMDIAYQRIGGDYGLAIYGRLQSAPEISGGRLVYDVYSNLASSLTRAQGLATGTYYFRPAVTIYGTSNITSSGRLTVTIYGPSSTTGVLSFHPVTPCRIMETRADYNFEGRAGAFGPPFMRAGETRTLSVPQSNVCALPPDARALVLNVTVLPRGSLDFATVWPAGEPRPDFWTVRSPDGQIVANSAIVKAGTSGNTLSAISIYASHDADVLIDISGYFSDRLANGTNIVFYPLTPCRVIDTRLPYRSPPGPFGPPTMAANETRRFRFPVTPYCSIPSGATAYSATLTVVPPQPLPFMTLWPAGGNRPNVSSINSFAGRTLANNVIVPAAADGSIDVFAFQRTDLLVDINGYFAPDDGTTGLYYFPVTQCRASNSLVSGGIYADETTRTIDVPSAATCSGISPAAKAFAVNVTAMPQGLPMPFVTVSPTGEARPNSSVLNAFEGQIVTSASLVPSGTNGAIDVFAFRRTHVAVEIAGYFGR